MKKLWNMKVKVIPFVIGTLGTVCRGLERKLGQLEIRTRIEIIHITSLLRSVRILRRVQEIRARIEIIHTTVLLRSVRILRRVLEIRARIEIIHTTVLLRSVRILTRVLEIRRDLSIYSSVKKRTNLFEWWNKKDKTQRKNKECPIHPHGQYLVILDIIFDQKLLLRLKKCYK